MILLRKVYGLVKPHLTSPNLNKLGHSMYASIFMYGSKFEIKQLRVSLRNVFFIGPRDAHFLPFFLWVRNCTKHFKGKRKLFFM